MYNYDTVIEGIVAYVKREVLPSLPDYAKVLGGAALLHNVSRISEILRTMGNTSILGTLDVVTQDGNVDVDTWSRDLRNSMNEFCNGKLEIKLPLLSPLIFNTNDVETLSRYMKGELR